MWQEADRTIAGRAGRLHPTRQAQRGHTGVLRHLLHALGFCGNVILRVGTLDDPSLYEGPKLAIFCAEKQPYHLIPAGLPAFEALPE